ncbi:MAG: hypothetical protein GJ680_18375 [Alteromonadaceae bacterium]|nr:hypothetical protein [Alteromonadaceae bacterium]
MRVTKHEQFIIQFDDAIEEKVYAALIRVFENFSHTAGLTDKSRYLPDNKTKYLQMPLKIEEDPNMAKFFTDLIIKCYEAYCEAVPMMLPLTKPSRFDELTIAKYTAAENHQFDVHADALTHFPRRYISFVMYLNDVEEGGETVFPLQNVSVTPKAGSILMFPSGWTHQHYAKSPISCDKYIIAAFANYPILKSHSDHPDNQK